MEKAIAIIRTLSIIFVAIAVGGAVECDIKIKIAVWMLLFVAGICSAHPINKSK